MVKFVPIMTAIILASIFTIALITGGAMLQIQNNAKTKITEDSSIGNLSSDITQTLDETSSNAQTADTAFTNSSVTTTGVTPYVNAIGGLWQILKRGPVLTYNIISAFIFQKLLGNSAAFLLTSALAAIFILIVISAIVYWISRGEGG